MLVLAQQQGLMGNRQADEFLVVGVARSGVVIKYGFDGIIYTIGKK